MQRNKLGRRRLSIILTIALVVGLMLVMPGSKMTVHTAESEVAYSAKEGTVSTLATQSYDKLVDFSECNYVLFGI